jgi:hypothetical protein
MMIELSSTLVLRLIREAYGKKGIEEVIWELLKETPPSPPPPQKSGFSAQEKQLAAQLLNMVPAKFSAYREALKEVVGPPIEVPPLPKYDS